MQERYRLRYLVLSPCVVGSRALQAIYSIRPSQGRLLAGVFIPFPHVERQISG